MITPPLHAPVFYSAILEGDAANFLTSLLTDTFAKSGDIQKVMITSQDFTSDIAAANELHEGTREIASHITAFDEEVDTVTRYNPMLLPKENAIFDLAELDHDGDILTVDGFASPYVMLTTKISTTSHPEVIDGKVVFKQFEISELNKGLERTTGHYLS
jgi:hypothetical protein